MKTALTTLILILFSFNALASYESKKALLNHIHKAGYMHVVQISTGDFSFKVHVKGEGTARPFHEYVHQVPVERAEELDYAHTSINSSYRAFVVADHYICYELDSIGSRIKKKLISSDLDNIDHCLIVPEKIDSVLFRLRRTPKEEDGGEEDS